MEPEYGPYQETLTPPGSSYTVREDQTAVPSISCSVNCKPGCIILWEINGSIITTKSVLNLGQSERSQTGSYRCRAFNDHGSVYTSSINVNVLYGATISEFTLNTAAGPLVTVSEGDTVTLECQVDSDPPATLRLLNGSQELKRGDNPLSVISNWNTTCRQTGNYSCMATNAVGPAAFSGLYLEVLCSPRPDETFPMKYKFASRLGSSVTLWMSVLSNPIPAFAWSRSNSPFMELIGSLNILSDISVNISLTLTSLRREDFELYRLDVDNGIGREQVTMFEVVPEGPPDLPTDVQVREITPNAALVSWTRGFNGGDTQHFTVSYSTDNTSWQNSSKIEEKETADHYDITLSKLNPSTLYTVRVITGNKFGDSEYTEAVLLETKADPIARNHGTRTRIGFGITIPVIVVLVVVVEVMYRKGNTSDQSQSTNKTQQQTTYDVGLAVPVDRSTYDTLDKSGTHELNLYENTKR